MQPECCKRAWLCQPKTGAARRDGGVCEGTRCVFRAPNWLWKEPLFSCLPLGHYKSHSWFPSCSQFPVHAGGQVRAWRKLRHRLLTLKQEVSLSRKFWSAQNFGPRSKIFGKIGPGGHCFSEKIGPDGPLFFIVVARRARCISSSQCIALR